MKKYQNSTQNINISVEYFNNDNFKCKFNNLLQFFCKKNGFLE